MENLLDKEKQEEQGTEPVSMDKDREGNMSELDRVRVAHDVLEEAVRFAEADGIGHPEAQNRLQDALEQVQKTELQDKEKITRQLLHINNAQDLINVTAALSKAMDDLNNEHQVYSNYEPGMNVETNCMACARAHLLAVSQFLNQAVNSEDNSQQQREYIENAAGELIQLERFDWDAEKIQNIEQEQRQIVERYLPEVRKLRQKLLNETNNPQDLKDAAYMASQIWNRYSEDTGTFYQS